MFGVFMYQFAAAQQTNKAKLPAFFQRFQTEELVLRFNKTKSTGESALNGDYFGSKSNLESSNDKKTLF